MLHTLFMCIETYVYISFGNSRPCWELTSWNLLLPQVLASL